MATKEVLDFPALLMPIPGDKPTGRPLREDMSPGSVYYTIKDARTLARNVERKLLQGGDDSEGGGERPDWEPVLELVPKVLAEESKDLELVAWLIEALVREHGFAGVRDGFRLARELVQLYWDTIYPLPDDEGIYGRVAPFTGLNGEDTDGVLIKPIANVPITSPRNIRPLSLVDYQQAKDLEQVTDPGKRAARIDAGVATLETFNKAVLETPTEFLQELKADLTACMEEFQKFGTVMDEKCGKGPDGFPASPPTSTIRNALQAVLEEVERFTKDRSDAGESAAGAGDGAAAGQSVAGGVSGAVRTRDDAFRALLQTADFFKRTEPHSPVSYLLEQAVRWGRMPLPDLWAELIPEEDHRLNLFKLVGIRPPERPAENP